MDSGIPDEIIHAVSAKTGLKILCVQPVSGGCIHHAHRLDMAKGSSFFIKFNHRDHLANFKAEQRGLSLLASTQTVPVPLNLQTGETEEYAYLLMHWIESGPPGHRYWTNFGQYLAYLHQHTHPKFGLDHQNFIGSLPQQNALCDTWAEFFMTQRLEPMLRMASQRGYVDRGVRRQFDSLAGRLSNLFPEEPPALIHGDLWGGNILCNDQGEAVMIDPAVYYGHREMELAFMSLFDRQPPEFLEAYESVLPLEPDWQSRIDLCNLYPLLVHVNLFGGSYLGLLRSALSRYV